MKIPLRESIWEAFQLRHNTSASVRFHERSDFASRIYLLHLVPQTYWPNLKKKSSLPSQDCITCSTQSRLRLHTNRLRFAKLAQASSCCSTTDGSLCQKKAPLVIYLIDQHWTEATPVYLLVSCSIKYSQTSSCPLSPSSPSSSLVDFDSPYALHTQDAFLLYHSYSSV